MNESDSEPESLLILTENIIRAVRREQHGKIMGRTFPKVSRGMGR